MKHLYHEYTTEDALDLARDFIHGPLPPKDAPIPSIDEAIAVISEEVKTSGFNWITGRVALEVLRASKGEDVKFQTL